MEYASRFQYIYKVSMFSFDLIWPWVDRAFHSALVTNQVMEKVFSFSWACPGPSNGGVSHQNLLVLDNKLPRWVWWAEKYLPTPLLLKDVHVLIPGTYDYTETSWWPRWWKTCLQCRRSRFDPWVGKIPWGREWLPTPVFLAGQFCGHRNLASYSPWGHKESDTIEWLTLMNVFRYVFLYILHIKICYVLLLWELRLQIKLSLLISWYWNGKEVLDYTGGPDRIMVVLKNGKRRQCSV